MRGGGKEINPSAPQLEDGGWHWVSLLGGREGEKAKYQCPKDRLFYKGLPFFICPANPFSSHNINPQTH